MKTKTNLSLLATSLIAAPFSLHAQFVEQQGETPSEFSTQGLETFNVVVDIMNVFLAILFIFSIFGLVISGVKFIVAGGSETVLGSARKTGIASIIGLILSLVGYIIINGIKFFLT